VSDLQVMIVKFSKTAETEYNQFKSYGDQNCVDKIVALLKSILSEGVDEGLGKPERLKYFKHATYSRRINREHRLVYQEREGVIYVLSCMGHYKK